MARLNDGNRLSGMATEHHPEGPGDGPRLPRKRGRKSKAASDGQPSSPVKRAASPSFEHKNVTSVKRLKHVQVDAVQSQVSDDSIQSEIASASQPVESVTLERHEEVQRTRRRFSEPVAGPNEDESSSSQRFKASRRARMSLPAQMHLSTIDETNGENEIQFASLREVMDGPTRRRLRRNHLSETMNENHEEDKKHARKLRKYQAQLEERDARIRDLDDKVKDLNFQLEAARLGNIQISQQEKEQLEHRLDEHVQQREELRASSVGYAENDAGEDDSDYEQDDVVYVHPDELNISQDQMEASPLPRGFYTERAIEASQITLDSLDDHPDATQDTLLQLEPGSHPDRISDKAVRRYEAEIEELLRLLSESKGALRCVTIELQNLDLVADKQTTAKDAIVALRHVLEDCREQYEKISASSAAGLNNTEFLNRLMEDLEGMTEELLEKTELNEKLNSRLAVAESQYQGTMDLLAETDTRNAELQEQLESVQTLSTTQTQQIEQLHLDLDHQTEIANEQADQLEEQQGAIADLNKELENKTSEGERLTAAVEQFREEAEKLTDTITELEKAHEKRIDELVNEHAVEINDLQAQVQTEAADRAEYEELALQRLQLIDELQGKLSTLEKQAEDLTVMVDEQSERLTSEQAARELAEEERNQHAVQISEHEDTIQGMRENIAILKEELLGLTTNLEAEQAQREQTEQDLTEANKSIAALESRLHNSGVQANELRSKLFQLQQERDSVIQQLQEEADSREVEFNATIQNETERRTTAEDRVSELEAQIFKVEGTLATTEEALAQLQQARSQLEADRDAQAEKLNRQLEDLRSKYSALEKTSKEQIVTLQATITDLNNDVEELRNRIQTLEDTANATAIAHAEELEERDTVVADLQSTLHAEQQKIADLEKENRKLQQDVQNQAMEFLNIDMSRQNTLASLQDALNSQKAVINELTLKAENQAASHADKVAEMQEEINTLRLAADTRVEMIAKLEANVEEMEEKFRSEAAAFQDAINAMLDKNRATLAEQEDLVAQATQRGREAVKAIGEMRVKGLTIKTQGVDLKKVVNGKVTKVTEKVKVKKTGRVGKLGRPSKVRDSGIGMDDEDEENFEGVVG
ncbi:hypothetical protein M011DRAFT_463622 [Sporormia fimetaria CBS 119925]|uniref:Uncharacterized protein n=1 Tax=Sporormia fimetaria CBS 119925 TaxID=1340428 RepID=A0A6A6VQJ4_9PLEO|nr:hypothetical protein M011DRAFT_463622 [Sporormia fimetaria CBS 119925]